MEWKGRRQKQDVNVLLLSARLWERVNRLGEWANCLGERPTDWPAWPVDGFPLKSYSSIIRVHYRKYLSLTSHFIALQVLVVGGDFINQLSVYNLHNTICRRLHNLMVTG